MGLTGWSIAVKRSSARAAFNPQPRVASVNPVEING